MIGSLLVVGWARSSLQSARPSTPGISRSRATRSQRTPRKTRNAEAASLAVTTRYCAVSKISRSRSRAAWSSSTIKRVAFWFSAGDTIPGHRLHSLKLWPQGYLRHGAAAQNAALVYYVGVNAG